MGQPVRVRCPQCGAESVWDQANSFRPFCSERCKLIDLGAWASEAYRVPATDDPQSPGDASSESSGNSSAAPAKSK